MVRLGLTLAILIHAFIIISKGNVKIKILQITEVVEALGPLPIEATFTANIPPGAGSAAGNERHRGRWGNRLRLARRIV